MCELREYGPPSRFAGTRGRGSSLDSQMDRGAGRRRVQHCASFVAPKRKLLMGATAASQEACSGPQADEKESIHKGRKARQSWDGTIPPYQLSDGGAQASAKPVYQLFVEQAKKLNPRYMTMIMPARWYSGGKGLDAFRDSMLNDTSIRELHDFPITSDCFPGVNIRGGVCYFLWDRDYDNSRDGALVVTHDGDKSTAHQRPLKYGDLGIFIRYAEALSVLEKVTNICGSNTLAQMVSARKPFGLDTPFARTDKFHATKAGLKHPVSCYGKGMKIGYVERTDIPAHTEWIDRWKVYVPRANNIGTELPDDNLNSFLGAPNTACTESYIAVGGDLNLSEAEASRLCAYLRTKFVRFLHSLAKVSQDATSKTYRFVPAPDLSRDYSDKQLYELYGLTDDEVAFVEETIQPMS